MTVVAVLMVGVVAAALPSPSRLLVRPAIMAAGVEMQERRRTRSRNYEAYRAEPYHEGYE